MPETTRIKALYQPTNYLSKRETEVLKLTAQCKSPREIGEQLFLSVQSVYTYRNRMMSKMGFRNNLDIIRYALENNIID